MNVMESARKLVESALEEAEIEDLAHDFVENEVGANKFKENWTWLRQHQDVVAKVKSWLRQLGTDQSYAPKIIAVIDELHAKPGNWLTPFTAPALRRFKPGQED
jgi:hypothetical protein